MNLSVRQHIAWGKVMATLCVITLTLCWGEDAVAAADDTRNVQAAHEALGKMRSMNSSITDAFEWVAKGKVTYSHTQHTTTEAR